ncbi:MAG: hypothetical protein CMM93_05730 [Rickettsiales bacterium]|nr:hypothetical protein [Rickettsiales bacterium]|tara:strand:+ start:302 stop:619 length:318 start_codon:yes stop_codon:yes gene_type:complete
MLVSTVRFNQFLTATKTTLQQLAEMEPKRSVSYYSALAKGKKDPSTKVRYEIMHKTNGYVMPWDWYEFSKIPAKFMKSPKPFTLMEENRQPKTPRFRKIAAHASA